MDQPLDDALLDWLRGRLKGRLGPELRRNHGSTEDLVQEALLRLERSGPHLRGRDPEVLRRYLLRIAENVLVDWIRYDRAAKRSVRDVISSLHGEPIDLDRIAAPVTDPRTELADGEMVERLLLALEWLEPEDRQVIVRRQLEGLPWRTVGQILGVSEDAARMRFTRALGRLADRIIRGGDLPLERDREA